MIETEFIGFLPGDVIRDKESDKLGVVFPSDYDNDYQISYKFLDDLETVHTCAKPLEKLELFYRAKRVHWSYYAADLFD